MRVRQYRCASGSHRHDACLRGSQAGLAGMLGMAGSSNVQGEDQKKLDVLANDVFITLLRKSGQCAVLVRLQVTMTLTLTWTLNSLTLTLNRLQSFR